MQSHTTTHRVSQGFRIASTTAKIVLTFFFKCSISFVFDCFTNVAANLSRMAVIRDRLIYPGGCKFRANWGKLTRKDIFVALTEKGQESFVREPLLKQGLRPFGAKPCSQPHPRNRPLSHRVKRCTWSLAISSSQGGPPAGLCRPTSDRVLGVAIGLHLIACLTQGQKISGRRTVDIHLQLKEQQFP